MKAPIKTPQEKPSVGGVSHGFSTCFLTVIRLNILRFNSKKWEQTFLLSSLEHKNKEMEK